MDDGDGGWSGGLSDERLVRSISETLASWRGVAVDLDVASVCALAVSFEVCGLPLGSGRFWEGRSDIHEGSGRDFEEWLRWPDGSLSRG